jgi:hypothetical protein
MACNPLSVSTFVSPNNNWPKQGLTLLLRSYGFLWKRVASRFRVAMMHQAKPLEGKTNLRRLMSPRYSGRIRQRGAAPLHREFRSSFFIVDSPQTILTS